MKSNLLFYEEEHKYVLDETVLQSVTQILGLLDDDFSNVKPEILDKAREKGNVVHKFCEEYVLSKATIEPVITDDYSEYMFNFMYFWNEFHPLEATPEIKLHHEYNYAGTCDLLAKRGGVWYIIDYKTSSTTSLSHKWGLQLALYQRALESMGYKLGKRLKCRRMVVHLTRTTPKLLDLSDSMYLYVADVIIQSIIEDTLEQELPFIRDMLQYIKHNKGTTTVKLDVAGYKVERG